MVCRLVPGLLVCRTDKVHPALLRSCRIKAIALMFFWFNNSSPEQLLFIRGTGSSCHNQTPFGLWKGGLKRHFQQISLVVCGARVDMMIDPVRSFTSMRVATASAQMIMEVRRLRALCFEQPTTECGSVFRQRFVSVLVLRREWKSDVQCLLL
ncbi:hypothetical protein Tco_0783726 [Tanacetum coccineum]